jgi:hypothetical protein
VELAQEHLVGEYEDLQVLWRAIWRRRYEERINLANGVPHGFLDHPETTRFLDRPELVVARADFLRSEGADRGLELTTPLEVNIVSQGIIATERAERLYVIEEFDGWYPFCVHVGWTFLNGSDSPAQPWTLEGIAYDDYRLTSAYADGVVGVTPGAPEPGTPGWGSDAETD